MSKLQNVKFLLAFVEKIDAVLSIEQLFSDYPIITAAIRREVQIL